MVPQGFGLIRELFGDEGQQKAFAVFGPVMGLAAVAGPLLGGGLVNLDMLGTGWRAIFLVNVPIGLLAIVGRPSLPAARGAGDAGPAAGRAQRADGDGRQRRARVPADRGSLAGLAGLVVCGCWPAGAGDARRVRRPAAPPLAPGPDAAGGAVDPAPPSLRGRSGRRRRLHRGDGRDDDRAQRDVPGRARLLAARLRRGDRGDPAGGDRRLDHVLGAAGAHRPRHHADRDRDDGDRPARGRRGDALGGRRR